MGVFRRGEIVSKRMTLADTEEQLLGYFERLLLASNSRVSSAVTSARISRLWKALAILKLCRKANSLAASESSGNWFPMSRATNLVQRRISDGFGLPLSANGPGAARPSILTKGRGSQSRWTWSWAATSATLKDRRAAFFEGGAAGVGSGSGSIHALHTAAEDR